MPHKDLTDQSPAESSEVIRGRVNRARQIQRERLAPFGLHANSQMQARHIRRFCRLDEKGDQLLEQVTDKLGLSARSFTRILKLARTIADLAGSGVDSDAASGRGDSVSRAGSEVGVRFPVIPTMI